MIGKVLRGTNVRRLLYYLYGPGKSNEHDDPHLVAGFGDPADLEPERRQNGSRDFGRLTGLLTQPLHALAGPGYDKPVWHCSVRAAPDDRLLSDAEWAQIAGQVMDKTGLAPADDELGVRWVAVRHGSDHVHLVATLARQDGTRPRIWNDFYRVREACRDAETRFGLRATAPADRTSARRPSRAETEQSARRRWDEPPRVTLRRVVCTAAAGARNEQEFFTGLAQAGVTARKRYSAARPGEVSGYAVGLSSDTARDGGIVWYGGGKLAADLTLPRLRRRWTGTAQDPGAFPGTGLSAAAARALLRNMVTTAAEQAPDEAGFFAGLREAGVLVRLRFSQARPGRVTGYAVGLPGHHGPGGVTAWYGGGRLAADLTLPRLRRRWSLPRNTAERSGTFRFTVPERNAIFEHAARQVGIAAEQIRRASVHDPAAAADAAWAAADVLHVAARALRSRDLGRAADSYDRAAREPYGRTPHATHEGSRLRAAARMIALAGQIPADSTLTAAALVANLTALAIAIAELRAAQQHAAQAAAARATAMQLHYASPSANVCAQQHTAQDRKYIRVPIVERVTRGDGRVTSQPGRGVLAAPSPAWSGRTPGSPSARRTRPGK